MSGDEDGDDIGYDDDRLRLNSGLTGNQDSRLGPFGHAQLLSDKYFLKKETTLILKIKIKRQSLNI